MEGILRGCFLNLLNVSLLKKTVLSKSSTLTRAIERLLIVWSLPVARREKYDFWFRIKAPLVTSWEAAIDASLSFSGSNQARKGRLVNALAVRGDEGRDTLR